MLSVISPAPADGAVDSIPTPINEPPGRPEIKTTAIAVQWNLRGLAEIKTKKKKDTDKLDRERYDWRICFKPSDGYSNGAALGIDRTVPHSFLDVRGPLQVVAARMEWPIAATFASICICREDGRAEIEDKLDKLIPQPPAPVVLLGDFNAHSPLGAATT
ncbi:hypothetical protein quinque_014216 [Culex quinquefasciatus]